MVCFAWNLTSKADDRGTSTNLDILRDTVSEGKVYCGQRCSYVFWNPFGPPDLCFRVLKRENCVESIAVIVLISVISKIVDALQ